MTLFKNTTNDATICSEHVQKLREADCKKNSA